MKIKTKPTAKILSPAELATWTDEALEAAYRRHLDQWMARRDSGKPNTWRRFNQMDSFHLELTRRRYGDEAVADEKAAAANFKMGLVPERMI